MACLFVWLLSGSLGSAHAAELFLNFNAMNPGPIPAEFRPAVTGGGPASDWKLVSVDRPSALPALPGETTPMSRETVLAQMSSDSTDERFPLLIYEPTVFHDFTATLTFRTVSGRVEQMAGLAFRLQDPTNYYVLRASTLGRSFRFYKFVNGVRSDPIGPEVRIPLGEWHTLEVEAKGNTLQCRLNGKEAMPPINDTSFMKGKMAFWTKSDSVSQFRSLKVVYDVTLTLPEMLVQRGMDRFPRLLGLTVYGRREGKVVALASSDPALVGTEGTAAEAKALDAGDISADSQRDHAGSVFPLSDRNGEPMYAVRLKMRTFPGQTDSNAAARGRMIVDFLDEIVRAADRP
ncbi:MAG: DUF1080 domain-containing protein [Nitrospira sp.]|nr:DUF1080 domain-containing protein [Nitrospira sp.]